MVVVPPAPAAVSEPTNSNSRSDVAGQQINVTAQATTSSSTTSSSSSSSNAGTGVAAGTVGAAGGNAAVVRVEAVQPTMPLTMPPSSRLVINVYNIIAI